jgi:hypothetical protein
MRIAILYKDNQVYVEFDPKTFREIFKKYFKETNNIDETFERIEKDLRKEALKG